MTLTEENFTDWPHQILVRCADGKSVVVGEYAERRFAEFVANRHNRDAPGLRGHCWVRSL